MKRAARLDSPCYGVGVGKVLKWPAWGLLFVVLLIAGERWLGFLAAFFRILIFGS